MEKAEIKSHLDQLHQELSRVDTIDDETRRMLQKIDADIHTLLESPPQQAAVVDTEDLKERLDVMALEFSTTHPKAGTVLRELMDMLVRIGV